MVDGDEETCSSTYADDKEVAHSKKEPSFLRYLNSNTPPHQNPVGSRGVSYIPKSYTRIKKTQTAYMSDYDG